MRSPDVERPVHHEIDSPPSPLPRCQVCGADHEPGAGSFCRVCGEPVLLWGWAP